MIKLEVKHIREEFRVTKSFTNPQCWATPLTLITRDFAQDRTFTNATYPSTCAFLSLSSAKISKCHKTTIWFIFNRDRFIEENAVPNLEVSNSKLGTTVFSPAPRELFKKTNYCTVTFKVFNVPIWHFEAFTVFMDI